MHILTASITFRPCEFLVSDNINFKQRKQRTAKGRKRKRMAIHKLPLYVSFEDIKDVMSIHELFLFTVLQKFPELLSPS